MVGKSNDLFGSKSAEENMILRALPYTLRWLGKYLDDTWTCRLLRHLPSALVKFRATIVYKGVKLQVNTGEQAGYKTFYLRSYEDAQETVFLTMAKNKRVFDVGANIGLFTLLAASRGAQVFAFEPSHLARRQLETNIALNDFGRFVTVVPQAISASDGIVQFFETRDDNWGVGRIFSYGHSGGKLHDYLVATNTLDFFISEMGMPDLVKIDIEGAEWLALKGASNTLARCDAPDFLIEFHPGEVTALGGSIDECVAQFSRNGFTQYEFMHPAMYTSMHIWSVFSKRSLALPGLRPVR